MTAPDAPPNKPGRLATSTYVLAGCGLAVIVISIPIGLISALTVLGSMLDSRFEAVQAEICSADPSDPSCR